MTGVVRGTGVFRFAQRAIALAFAAATLACCARTAAGGPSGGNAWTRHGILRIADLSEPDTLDPIVGNSQIDSDLADLWSGKFFDWSDTNELVPDLVTTVPTLKNGGISKDGLISKIDVRDPLTIAVHVKHPFAPFVSTFFGPSGTPFPVLPKHVLARYPDINRVAFNSRPVGTGPFIVEKWQRGNKIVFKANPHFWRGKPKLAEIWYTPVPDENTVVTQLKSHDVDMDYNLSSSAYASAHDIPGFRTTFTPFTQYAQLAFNTTHPALRDVRVRSALWYALDVPRLIETVTHGVNTPGFTDQPTSLWAYNPKAEHHLFDAAKARALLDAAGWKAGADGIRTKNGERLSLTIAGITGSATGNAVSVQVQNQWRAVGVEATPKLYTSALFFASYGAGGIVQNGKFDVAFYSWLNGSDPDDSTLWMCDQIPPHGQNVYHYCNRDLDARERIALTDSDRAARKAAYDAIQAALARDVPAIIPWYNRRVSVANADLKGWSPAHAVSSFWNCYAWSI